MLKAVRNCRTWYSGHLASICCSTVFASPFFNYCVREIVDVGACLPNEFKTCSLSVPWMDRHHPIFGKRFEFVQAYKPAFKVSFLQIKVRLVLDQIRREKRFQFGSVHGLICLVSPSPNSTISSLTP